MIFFEMNEESLYESNNTLNGLYPFSNLGIWHSGIHVHLSTNDKLLKLPYSSVYAGSNIFEEKATSNYIILRNEKFFSPSAENDSIIWFTIIKGFSTTEYQEYNGKTIKEWLSEKASLLNNVPFYFFIKTTIKYTSNTDDDLMYINYLANSNGEYFKVSDFSKIAEADTKKLDFINLKDLNNQYYIKPYTTVYSKDGEKIGKILKPIINQTISSDNINNEFCQNVKIKKEDIQLDNLSNLEGFFKTTGHYSESIDISGIEKEKEKVYLWNKIDESSFDEEFIIIEPNSYLYKKIKKICTTSSYFQYKNTRTKIQLMYKGKFVLDSLEKKRAVILLNNRSSYYNKLLPMNEGSVTYQLVVDKYEKNTDVIQITEGIGFDVLMYYLALKEQNQIDEKKFEYFLRLNEVDEVITDLTSMKKYYLNLNKDKIKLRKFRKIDLYEENNLITDLLEIDKNNNPQTQDFRYLYYVKPNIGNKISVNFAREDVYSVVRGVKKNDHNYFVGKYIFDFNLLEKGIPVSEVRYICESNESFQVLNMATAIELFNAKKEIIPVYIKACNSSKNGVIYLTNQNFSSLIISLEKNKIDYSNCTLTKDTIIGIAKDDFDFITFSDENIEEKKIKTINYSIKKNSKALVKAKFKEQKDNKNEAEYICIFPGSRISKYEDVGDYYLVHDFENKVYIYDKDSSGKENINYNTNKKEYSIKTDGTKELWFIYKYKICKDDIKAETDCTQTKESAKSKLYNSIINQLEKKTFALSQGYVKLDFNYTLGDVYINKKEYQEWKNNDEKERITCTPQKESYLHVYIIDDDKITPGYKEITPTFEGTLDLNNNVLKTEKINGNKYSEYVKNGEIFYIKESDIEKKEIDISKEISDNFIYLNYGKKALYNTDVLLNNKIYFKRDEKNDDPNYPIRNIVRDLVGTKNKDCIKGKEKEGANSREIFEITHIDKYKTIFKEKFKKITCQHPLEFDEKQIEEARSSTHLNFPYDSISDNVYKKFKSDTNSENRFYFFCAPYFVNILEKYKSNELNPYIDMNGVHFKCQPRLGKRQDPVVEFKSNIGFATAVPSDWIKGQTEDPKDNYSDRKFLTSLKKEINGIEYCFAHLNCPYGKSFAYKNMTSGNPHTGIDLPGCLENDITKLAPIIALVKGRIWACTTHKGSVSNGANLGYGRMMVIKGDNNYLYILGHLSSFANHKAGDYIAPGEIVAISGNTGHSDAPHLHLEIIECKLSMDDKAWDSVLNTEYNQLHEIDGGTKDAEYSKLMFVSKKVDGKNYYELPESWKNFRLNPLTGSKE